MELHHTFDFVEGVRTAPIAPGNVISIFMATNVPEMLISFLEIKQFYPASDEYFSYHDYDIKDVTKTLNDLQSYIDEEGPFDGAIGFSQGAGLIATYLLKWRLERQGDPFPFKCAIFFAGASPIDVTSLAAGELKYVDAQSSHDSLISLPTAHIWGANDPLHEDAERLLSICDKTRRNVYLHSQGHEIPSPKAKEDVQGCVRVIRRTIENAELSV
ncbi:DUF341 domain protein [Penicillium angulare]|uniref:DUF341 domain protein n=1 Tax=Penicillium angulare TaxID=116970 RepID=UPI002540925B|nr:DUF341 domain protein [Penicillium angulare]KAJ5291695.1 DUF341 domain protein [Penicillium angulare]